MSGNIKLVCDYLIGLEVIEMGYLSILGMMRCYMIQGVAMLRCKGYVKSLDPEMLCGKDNAMMDMLLRAQFGSDIAES